ncbi:hypothetical protein CDL12_16462 [Handroanthus impetiginosus]|uniref:Retrotransposon gag domain-containing protein n=1 Tax=Handroanthus impetiginosus TaxID=429701 RepID=A0A2G9H099_9LAMI|nr:hypothetical protein CDL12_16462 [Handroanthus impetiginosus]
MVEDQGKEIEQPLSTPPPGFGDATLGMGEPYITQAITLPIIDQCQGRAQNIAPQIALPQPIIPRHLFLDDHKDGLRRNDRHEVDEISCEVECLSKKLDKLKRRGTANEEREMLDLERNNSTFRDEILMECVPNNFRIPKLPNYDGIDDPQRHVNKFERIIRQYAISDAQKAQIFSTTLDKAADEWFTSLVPGTLVNYTQLARKFIYNFSSKKKAKRPYTHLFSIQQKEDEPLREFIDRFNTESLMVQDLRMDLVVAVLMNSLQPSSFRSKLSRSPPRSMEELMIMSEKYINEEEFSTMKD